MIVGIGNGDVEHDSTPEFFQILFGTGSGTPNEFGQFQIARTIGSRGTVGFAEKREGRCEMDSSAVTCPVESPGEKR